MKLICDYCRDSLDFPGVFEGKWICEPCKEETNDSQIHYIIYETTCEANGMKYIGKHKCKDLNDDTYLGSGTWLRAAVKLYGKHQFNRKILSTWDTEVEMNAEENRLITQDVIDSPDYFNLKRPGGRLNKDLQWRLGKRPTLVIYNDTIFPEPINICLSTGYSEKYVKERLNDKEDTMFLYYDEALKLDSRHYGTLISSLHKTFDEDYYYETGILIE